MSWIKQQLKFCIQSPDHFDCQSPPTPLLPRRVLRLTSPTTVKLHSSGPEERASYLCLSHCWGSAVPIKTTKATLEAYHLSIPWEWLPTTFQHAIHVTWTLGYRHLWIDSLCIVRMDLDDWRQQGSQMAHIYENAHLTICATSSSDSNGGLCFDTDPQNRITQTNFCNSNRASHMKNHLPLLMRAWAFQEKILAPRVVHFTHSELVWECRVSQNCECASKQGSWNDYTLAPKSKFTFTNKLLTDAAAARICNSMWHYLVSQYTEHHLTYDKDIFPALQGLAHKFASKKGLVPASYRAGLWEGKAFIHDLCWSSTDRGTSHTSSIGHASTCRGMSHRQSIWRAPTWSWASIVGTI
ncbi:HET-domain-containing protein, partial [Polyplosphaeria fusca]